MSQTINYSLCEVWFEGDELLDYFSVIILDIIHDGGVFYESNKNLDTSKITNNDVKNIIGVVVDGLIQYNQQTVQVNAFSIADKIKADVYNNFTAKYNIEDGINDFEKHALNNSSFAQIPYNIKYLPLDKYAIYVDGLPETWQSSPDGNGLAKVSYSNENEIVKDDVYDKMKYTNASLFDNGARTHLLRGDWHRELVNSVFINERGSCTLSAKVDKLDECISETRSTLDNVNFKLGLDFEYDGESYPLILADMTFFNYTVGNLRSFSSGFRTGVDSIVFMKSCVTSATASSVFTDLIHKTRNNMPVDTDDVYRTFIIKFMGDHSQLLYALYLRKKYIGFNNPLLVTYDELLVIFAKYFGLNVLYFDKQINEFKFYKEEYQRPFVDIFIWGLPYFTYNTAESCPL